MVTARSAGPGACEPRDLTLAFRLTSAERERVDTLARSEGISPSEFARRAVLGGVRASAKPPRCLYISKAVHASPARTLAGAVS